MTVIVDIRYINTHRKAAGMIDATGNLFTKNTFAVIDIEIVVFMKIVTYIYVRVTIQVYVCDADTQAISDNRAVDAAYSRNITEPGSIIPE